MPYSNWLMHGQDEVDSDVIEECFQAFEAYNFYWRKSEHDFATICRALPYNDDVLREYVLENPEVCLHPLRFFTLLGAGKISLLDPLYGILLLGRGKVSVATIEVLLEYSPTDVLRLHNHCFGYPIHIASGAAALDVVRLLLNLDPSTVRESDCTGWLPLHHACASQQSEEVILEVLKSYPDALAFAEYDTGRMPLHWACVRQSSVSLILELLGRFPEAARQPDKDGCLPLHLACRFQSSREVGAGIRDTYPEALDRANNDGKVPLDLRPTWISLRREHKKKRLI